MPRTILFLCPHNAAKSVLAVAYCRALAARRGLDVRVDSAGTDPDAEVWPSVVALLRADGLDVDGARPRTVSAADMADAWRVVSLGCPRADLPPSGAEFETWDDVPMASEDLVACRDAIKRRVEALVAGLVGA